MLAQSTHQKLKNAESSILFMREQHAKTLEGLHDEIHELQRKNASELTFVKRFAESQPNCGGYRFRQLVVLLPALVLYTRSNALCLSSNTPRTWLGFSPAFARRFWPKLLRGYKLSILEVVYLQNQGLTEPSIRP